MNLRELFATFGLDFDSSGVDKAEGSIAKLWTSVKSFGAALASTAVVRGIWNFVTGMADAADNIGDLSARTGVATGSLQRIGAALGTVGLDLTNTAKLMETMNLKLASPKGRQAIERLGVSATDANGALRDSEAVFLDITDRVSEMGTEAERTQALVSVFGQRGRALGALLGSGNSQIREMVEAMGGLEGITQDVIEGSGELETQMTVLDFATTSLKNELMKELLPIVLDVVTGFLNFAKGAYNAAKQSNVMKAAIAVLGSAMVFWALATIEAWGPPLLLFGGIVLAIAAVIAIVDDVITLFEGGDSVIGDLIDSFMGYEGASRDFVDGVKLAWSQFTEWLPTVWDSIVEGAEAYNNWLEDMGRATDEKIALISGFFTGLWNTITGVATSIKETWTDIWNDPMAAAQLFWDWIVEFVQEKVASIGSSVSGLLNRVTGGALGTPSTTTTSTPRVATAPPRGGNTATTTVVNNTSVPVTITGNPSAEERRRLQQTINETLDARNRQAAAALVPTPAEDSP